MVKQTKDYITLPRGDRSLLKRIFGSFDLVDKRTKPSVESFKFNWNKLTIKSKAEQQRKVVEEWMKFKYGQICAPPRSGKTVIGVAISSLVNTRVAVFAHQYELIDQFRTTYQKFTTIFNKGKRLGRDLIKINPKANEIDDLSVCLFTYQQFIGPHGKKRLKAIRDKFGLVIVDESHRCPAECFSEVISKLKAKMTLGLSATPERKDGMHFKSNLILGPVVINAMGEQLPCSYSIKETGIMVSKFNLWTTYINRISSSKPRNELIVKWAARDVKKKGHKIIIPVERIHHALNLSNLLKEKGLKVACLTGKTFKRYRKDIVDDARKGKFDVLVATRKLISVGMDLPPFSCIYEVMPSSNQHNIYQEISRVRTPFEGKPNPHVRVFLDNCGASHACTNIMLGVFKKLNFKRGPA